MRVNRFSAIDRFILIVSIVLPVISAIVSPFRLPIYPSTSQVVSKVLESNRGNDSTFTFVFMGDNRNGDTIFRQIIHTINQLHPRPSFVIDDGDLVLLGTQMEYDKFLWMVRRSKVPVITLPGNHDATGFGRYVYEHQFTPPNPETGYSDYSFDYRGTRFVLLDNAKRDLSKKQLDWLRKMLETNERKIVVMHVPPFLESHWDTKYSSNTPNLQEFLEIVQKNSVDMVLLSHLHIYDDSVRLGNTQFIVSGGAGSRLHTSLHVGKKMFHFVLITVAPQGISYKPVTIPIHRNNFEYALLFISGVVVIGGWLAFALVWRILRRGSFQSPRSISYGSLPATTFYLIIGLAISLASWMDSFLPLRLPVAVAAFNLLGACIFLAGIILAISARRQLGKYWTASSAVAQHLVSEGPYALVRHPIYTGEILMALGTSIWATNWVLFVVLFGGIAIYNYYRARVEDQLFSQHLARNIKVTREKPLCLSLDYGSRFMKLDGVKTCLSKKIHLLKALIELSHPVAVLIWGSATWLFAIIATHGSISTVLLLKLIVVVISSQVIIGATNEYADRFIDAELKPWRPIPSGRVSERTSIALAIAFFIVMIAVAYSLGPIGVVGALLGTCAGLAHNFIFKKTAFSWVPFVVGYTLHPIWIWTVTGNFSWNIGRLPVYAFPLIIGLHFADQLPDVSEYDLGVYGLVHRLGLKQAFRVTISMLLISPLVMLVPFVVFDTLQNEKRLVYTIGVVAYYSLLGLAIWLYTSIEGRGGAKRAFRAVEAGSLILITLWLASIAW